MPSLACCRGQRVSGLHGIQVQGCATWGARLLGGRGDTEAVAETYHLSVCFFKSGDLLARRSVVVNSSADLQPANPGGAGLEQHHPHFPPCSLLQTACGII